jgi:hypothetical protein
MFLISRTRRLAFSILSLGFLTITMDLSAGGKGAGQNDGRELSGPPQLSATYQTREPRLCKALNTPPNQAQAAVLVQCTMDQDRPTGLFLMQDVKGWNGAAAQLPAGDRQRFEGDRYQRADLSAQRQPDRVLVQPHHRSDPGRERMHR